MWYRSEEAITCTIYRSLCVVGVLSVKGARFVCGLVLLANKSAPALMSVRLRRPIHAVIF